jgi:hypothetical protein
LANIACFYTLKGLARETQKMVSPAVPSVAVAVTFLMICGTADLLKKVVASYTISLHSVDL